MAGINRTGSGSLGDSPNLTSEDIFHRFFRRDSNQRFSTEGMKRGENVTQDLELTLEEIYTGVQKSVSFVRDRPCMACDGNRAGGMNNNRQDGREVCLDCRGNGMRDTVRQMGPNIVNHVSSPCTSCEGRGDVTRQDSRPCRVCNGSATTKDRTLLTARIERGTLDGCKLCFRGEGALPARNAIPGDAILVVKQKPHRLFKRSGNDLSMVINLSLTESLCGYERNLFSLDGSALKVRSAPSAVTKPNSIYVKDNHGMPIPVSYPHHKMLKGRLFVKFRVEFPDSLPSEVADVISQCLPAESSSRRMSIGGDEDVESGTATSRGRRAYPAEPRLSRGEILRRESQSVLRNKPEQEDDEGIPLLQPFSPSMHEPYGAFMRKELQNYNYNIQATSDASDTEFGSHEAGCGQQ